MRRAVSVVVVVVVVIQGTVAVIMVVLVTSIQIITAAYVKEEYVFLSTLVPRMGTLSRTRHDTATVVLITADQQQD